MRRIQYRAIYSLTDRYSVLAMCNALKISRSSYYRRLKDPYDQRDIKYLQIIRSVQLKTKQTYGYRRMTIEVNRRVDIAVNHKRILRIMNKYDLLSVVRRKNNYKNSQGICKYENRLNRNFKADHINQKWCTDISYIITPEGRLYLSVIKDLFDKSIIAYKYSTYMSMNLVIDTIKAALKKESAAGGCTLHSDQGFQYTSPAYTNLLKEYNIIPSMSRAGTPIDNAPVESFFSCFKTECIYINKPKNINEAKQLIDEYIDFYNNERIQLSTKIAPSRYRQKYLTA